MSLAPGESAWRIRKVHIIVDDLVTLELSIWTENDDDAITKACRSARAIIKAIGAGADNTKRYANLRETAVVEPGGELAEHYNGVADV